MPHSRRLGDNRKSTLKFYRRVARRGWGGTDFFTYPWRYPVVREWVAAQMPRRKCAVLSVGCGSGELEKRLARAGHHVVGLDLSLEMLRKARRKRLRVVLADGIRLPFRGGQFDVVVLWESIGHLQVSRALAEARRVLRSRGELLLATYPQHWPAHGTYRPRKSADLARTLTKSGFVVRERQLLRITARQVQEVDAERNCTLVYFTATKAPDRRPFDKQVGAR